MGFNSGFKGLNRWRRCQFSRLLAGELCTSACRVCTARASLSSAVMWRLLATHSILLFLLYFPSRASPCAITFQLDSNKKKLFSMELFVLRRSNRTRSKEENCRVQYLSVVQRMSAGQRHLPQRQISSERHEVSERDSAKRIHKEERKVLPPEFSSKELREGSTWFPRGSDNLQTKVCLLGSGYGTWRHCWIICVLLTTS